MQTIKNQTLCDVALQQTGTIESLFSIAAANNISVSDTTIAGIDYIIPISAVADNKILKTIADKNILFGTQPYRPGAGVEYMEIGRDFMIS